jgi:hypothetical protein
MPKEPVPPPSKLMAWFRISRMFIIEKQFFTFMGSQTYHEVKLFKRDEEIKIVRAIDYGDYWDIIVKDPAKQGLMDGGCATRILGVPKSTVHIFENIEIPISVPPPRKR